MTSSRNFITAWMKYTARMSSIWWCWFQRAPDFSNLFSWVFVLITQLRISAGGPNSVLLTTQLHVCKGWRASYRQAKESLCGFLNFSACADEKPVLPTCPVGCKCQWELRHQGSSCFATHSLKAFQKSCKSSADGFLSPQKPRIHLQRVLQTCCGHQPAVCRRELFNGHFTAVRGHQNM